MSHSIASAAPPPTLIRRLRRNTIFVFFLANLGLVASARADCMLEAYSAWPTPGMVPANSLFLLQGHLLGAKVVVGLREEQIQLVAKDHQVAVQIVERHVGQRDMAQVLLRPSQPLKPGQSYRLELSNLGTETAWDFPDNPPLRGRWTILEESDHSAPRWISEPTVESSEVTYAGCGPIIHARLAVPTTDTSEQLLRVRLSTAGEADQSFLVPMRRGFALVGHGMCSGAFQFTPGYLYRAEIEVMDAGGNRAESGPRELFFAGPG